MTGAMMKPRTVGHYRRLEKIGYGNFGVVYRGIDTHTNRVVAIKTLDLDTVEDEVESVRHEVGLLSHLSAAKSSNVTRYYGTVLDGSRLWVVMDLCSGGSVRTLLQAGPLEDKFLGVLFREIAIGVAAIHSEGIIHRDLKAANVLITMQGSVKLCDFGVAAVTQSSKRNTVVGTPYWMAPEVITEGQSYTNKADIWSLGITFYELVTGNPPYAELEAMRALLVITSSRPSRLEGPKYAPALKDIIALCLDEDPKARPSAEEILKHKFVKTYSKVPTVVLKQIVERYIAWKEKRQDHRDSLLMFNPHQEEEEESSDSESVWDFGIEGESTLNLENVEPDDMRDAPDSFRELFGVPPRAQSPQNLGSMYSPVAMQSSKSYASTSYAPADTSNSFQFAASSQASSQVSTMRDPNSTLAASTVVPQSHPYAALQNAPHSVPVSAMPSPAASLAPPAMFTESTPVLSRQKSESGLRSARISPDPPQLGVLEFGPSLARSATQSRPAAKQPSAVPISRSRSTTVSASPFVDGWKGWRRFAPEKNAQNEGQTRAPGGSETAHLASPVGTPKTTPLEPMASAPAAAAKYDPVGPALKTGALTTDVLTTGSKTSASTPAASTPAISTPAASTLAASTLAASTLAASTPATITPATSTSAEPTSAATTPTMAAASATALAAVPTPDVSTSDATMPQANSSSEAAIPTPAVGTPLGAPSTIISPKQSPLSSPSAGVTAEQMPQAIRRRAPLPQLQMPPRPKLSNVVPVARAKKPVLWPSEFPPMPEVDSNALLDSSPDDLVYATLLELATGYKTAIATLAGQFE